MAAKEEGQNVSLPIFGDTPMVAAIIVLAALGLLIAVERGFRGVSIGVS